VTKKDVKIGETYRMNHSSGKIDVRILRAVERSAYSSSSRTRLHWIGINLKTGREIEIKSAAKLTELPPA
jgi:hypothetical protein